MLVKFGIKGLEVKEYFLEDLIDDCPATLEDLLDIVNLDLESNDVFHVVSGENKELFTSKDFLSEVALEEGRTYIFETLYLTKLESEILNLIDENEPIMDMLTHYQKEFVKKLINLVNKSDWDK